jgi:predicted RNA methylase
LDVTPLSYLEHALRPDAPARILFNGGSMLSKRLLESIHAGADETFDLLYPEEVRRISSIHWTPVEVARLAAAFLVRKPGTRVLDIGCGPGKFCLVGALTTPGEFLGVEQRPHLCQVAEECVAKLGLPNARVRQGNIEDIDFSAFDAFYLFNPFGENLSHVAKIDGSVALSEDLYARYTEHVAAQFARAPLGTRIVTYYGRCEEIPNTYDCVDAPPEYELHFWEKTRCQPQWGRI